MDLEWLADDALHDGPRGEQDALAAHERRARGRARVGAVEPAICCKISQN